MEVLVDVIELSIRTFFGFWVSLAIRLRYLAKKLLGVDHGLASILGRLHIRVQVQLQSNMLEVLMHTELVVPVLANVGIDLLDGDLLAAGTGLDLLDYAWHLASPT